jgi:hypothetical protein
MSESFEDAKARVLAILKERAPEKVSTWDLIHLTRHSRAAGRVWDLTQEGYEIEHTQEGRTHYWAYRGKQEHRQASLFERGEE